MVDQLKDEGDEVKVKTDAPCKEKQPRFRFYRVFAGTVGLAIILFIAAAIWLQMTTGYFTMLINHGTLQSKISVLDELVAKQGIQIAQNQSLIAQFEQSSGKSQNNRALIEAENFIQLAYLNLMIAHNIPVTIRLLQMAYSHLTQANSPTAVEVQKILAQDITQLMVIQQVDIVTIYLELQKLSNQLSALPIMKEVTVSTQTDNKTDKTPQSFWRQGLLSSIETIKDLVIIRHRTQSMAPLISQSQQQLLVLNLQMLFSQAEWGVLNHQGKIYTASLQQISSLFKRYYLQTGSTTIQVSDELEKLLQINVEPDLPDLGKALAVIQTINRVSLQPKANTTAGPTI